MKEIDDNEIRILGSAPAPRPQRRWIWMAAGAAAVVLLIVLFLIRPSRSSHRPLGDLLTHFPSAGNGTLIVRDTVVDDVPLSLYIPLQSSPSLQIAPLDTTQLLLAVMAADIRADNGDFVGDFILGGKQLARGERKNGYCAIINGRLFIGHVPDSLAGTDADPSYPIRSQAITTGGSFFRQYVLVADGQAIPPKPKGKNHRRALCMIGGNPVVVASDDRESYADFATALADLGADEAIALVGSESLLIYRPDGGLLHSIGFPLESQKDNYLVWRK